VNSAAVYWLAVAAAVLAVLGLHVPFIRWVKRMSGR